MLNWNGIERIKGTLFPVYEFIFAKTVHYQKNIYIRGATPDKV
jgi:hypothetical protein